MTIYPDEVQAKIWDLEEQIHQLKFQITDREDQIERLKCGISPIKVGDIVRWESGKTLRRGRVQSIGASW